MMWLNDRRQTSGNRSGLLVCLTLVGAAVLVTAPRNAMAQDAAVAKAVREFRRQLKSEFEHQRVQAAYGLGKIGADASRAVPPLLFQIKQGSLAEKIAAARAVALIEPENAELFAFLYRVLEDSEAHYELQIAAVRALGDQSARDDALAQRIIPKLSGELRERRHNNLVAVALAETLGSLGDQAKSTAADLEKAVAVWPFPSVKVASFLALMDVIPREANRDLASLEAMLSETSMVSRAEAYARIRDLGAAAAKTVPALLEATASDREIYDRVAALECLAVVEPQNAEAIAIFAAAVAKGERYVAPRGELGLESIRPDHAEAAVSPLLEQLGTGNHVSRRLVVEALVRVAPTDSRVVRALVQLLERATGETDMLLLHAVFDGLRTAGAAAEDGSSQVAAALKTGPLHRGRDALQSTYLMAHALVVLAEIGVPDEVVPFVLEELEHHKSYVLVPAIRVAGALGVDAKAAVPALVKVVDAGWIYPVPFTFLHEAYPRLEAIRALGRIGSHAKAAIPVLSAIAREKTGDVAGLKVLEIQAARKALKEIRG